MVNNLHQPGFWLLLFLIVVCFSLAAFGLARLEAQSDRNTRVFCDLKRGYQSQLRDVEATLASPRRLAAVERLGYTRATILASRDSLRRRLGGKDMRELKCPPEDLIP